MKKSVLLVTAAENSDLFWLNKHLQSNYDVTTVLINLQKLPSLAQQLSEYALILLDFDPEFLSVIEQLNGSGSFTAPVVAFIEPKLSSYKAQLIKIGIDDFLTKPINYRQLAELLDVWQVQPKNPEAMSHILFVLQKTYDDQQLALLIFTKLFAELPQQLAEVKTALASENYTKAEFITHHMNGSLAVFGLSDLKAAGLQLEKIFLAKDFAECQRYFLTVDAELGNFINLQADILAYLQS